jgi:hypothetical protein
MGMVSLPSLASYWSTDDFFGNTGIKKVMTKNRFEEITCFIHFNDSIWEPAREARNFDRLYKVRPVIENIKGKFLNNFKPTKNISVDEGMIAYKVGYLSDSKCQLNRRNMGSKYGWPRTPATVTF